MGLITEYKCPGCGAPLAFDPTQGEVKCKNCGNSFEIDEILTCGKDEENSAIEFDWGSFKSEISSQHLDGTVVYSCSSCGAVLETNATTAATTCPYCENNIVISDRVSAGLKPNAIIPFAVDKSELMDIVRNFYKKKRLLPKNYFDESKIEKILGVYIPFWLFNCKVGGRVDFHGEIVDRVETAREIITTTKEYLLIRRGSEEFINIPVDASVKMDNSLMDSLEPFDYSQLKEFDGAYLSGFVADRFDSDPDKEIERAFYRAQNTLENNLRRTIIRYSSVFVTHNDIQLKDASVKYVLLPAYIINCDYNGKKYQYAVNGQTGKIVGTLPSSFWLGVRSFILPALISLVAAVGILWFIFMGGR